MHLVPNAKQLVILLILATGLGACAPATPVGPDGIYDPYEKRNRTVHAFNKGLDRAVLRPVGRTYTAIMPDEIEDSVGHFADNLGRPSDMLNAFLQGDLRGFGVSGSRFLINSTLGFGGVFDVASDFGVDPHDTDFGETLHVWGVPEGAYVEAPVFGPSTTRDSVGRIIGLFLDPLDYAIETPERYAGTVANVVSRVGDRGRFSDTVDGVLYDSADSYAQARLIYLQNRRFELGDDSAVPEIDPFALDTEGF